MFLAEINVGEELKNGPVVTLTAVYDSFLGVLGGLRVVQFHPEFLFFWSILSLRHSSPFAERLLGDQ